MKQYSFVILLILFVLCECGNDSKPQPSSSATLPKVSTPNETNVTKMNVLEFVSGMGKALQQMLSANGINIGSASTKQQITGETRTTNTSQESYKIQSEKLRAEIAKRVSQLQRVTVTAIEVLKERGDVLGRRILEQANNRLEQAKQRADKLLSEPANSEMAVRTLNTINTGLSNLTSFIQQVLSRVNISISINTKDKE